MSIKTVTVVPSRSRVVRSLAEREVLDLFDSRVAALSLRGYIFFGSSVSISAQVLSQSPVRAHAIAPLLRNIHVMPYRIR